MWMVDVLRCGSCRFAAYYVLPFWAALAGGGRLTPGSVLFGALFWGVFSLATELTNRLSDRLEDELNRPERTAICHRVGYGELARLTWILWLAIGLASCLWLALQPGWLLAVLLVLAILSSLNYSYGLRLKANRYLALFVLTFPFGGTFMTGWAVVEPPAQFPHWFEDLLIEAGPFLLVGGMFMYSLAGVKDVTDVEGDAKAGYRGLLVAIIQRHSSAILLALISAPFLALLVLLAAELAPARYALLFLFWPLSWLLALCLRQTGTTLERMVAREFFYQLWMLFLCVITLLYVPSTAMLAVVLSVLLYWIAATQALHWHGGLDAQAYEALRAMMARALRRRGEVREP